MRRNKTGWFGESYRHYLAAKGVKTSKYVPNKFLVSKSKVDDAPASTVRNFNPSQYDVSEDERSVIQFLTGINVQGRATPERRIKTLQETQRLQQEAEELIRSKTDAVEIAVQDLGSNRPASATRLLASGALTSSQRDLVKGAMNEYATRRAQAGLDISNEFKYSVDGKLMDMLHPGVRAQAEALARQRAELGKGEVRREFEKFGREQTMDFLAAGIKGAAIPARTGAFAFEGYKQLESDPRISFPGFLDDYSGVGRPAPNPTGLGATPFSDGNAITSGFVDARPGERNFFLNEAEPLSNRFDYVVKGKDVNAVMKRSDVDAIPVVDQVSQAVDQMFDSKDKLSKIDLTPYNVGSRAFENGDREELIRSIVDLKSQESMLKDRWNLLEYTRGQVLSMNNHNSAIAPRPTRNVMFMLHSGGDALAEQTRKLASVRKDLTDSANKVTGRRRMLEYRLQRLDSVAPPEHSVPDQVIRFSKPPTLSLLGVDNPISASKNPIFEELR